MEKQQITYKEIPIWLTADLSAEMPQSRREWQDIFKVMKWKNLQQRLLYQARISFKIGKIKTFYRQAKVKRIQHHQTNFTTNAKGTFLGRKHKRRERPKPNTPETIKKMVIGSYISIINLHVNGLNAPTKRYRLTDWRKTCIYALPLTTSLYLTTPIVHNYFIWLS